MNPTAACYNLGRHRRGKLHSIKNLPILSLPNHPPRVQPLNVIISNLSSPDVLRDTGFVAWARSLKLWNECANIHLGDPQFANLGDGGGKPTPIS